MKLSLITFLPVAYSIISLTPKHPTVTSQWILPDFHEVDVIKTVTHPTLSHLLEFVINKDAFKFKISNKEFIVEPLKNVKMIRNNKETCLGTFRRVTTSRNSVALEFTKGDVCSSGERYECLVFITSDAIDSYRQDITEVAHRSYIYIRTSEPLIVDEKKVVGLVATRPIIGNKIVNLMKQSQESKSVQKNLKSKDSEGRTTFLIKNRLMDSAHTINERRIREMADMFSKALAEDNNQETEEKKVEKSVRHNEQPCKTIISKKKEPIKDTISKSIPNLLENLDGRSRIKDRSEDEEQEKKKKKIQVL